MDKIRNFRDLIVWQKSHQLFLDIVIDTEKFPNKRAAQVIANQILRSSSSISANIAEGFGRRKGKEYLHYLIISRGSTTETLNWLIKCIDLRWISDEVFKHRERTIEELMKMLNKMIGQQIN